MTGAMRVCLALVLTALTCGSLAAEKKPATPLMAEDAHGVRRTLNPAAGVSVVLYSNPAVQDRTRAAGLALHPFLEHTLFQFIVLVDLRGTMADWARGYTKRRIQRDLEAKFNGLPPVPGRAPLGPHPQIGAIADFDGAVCRSLGWKAPGKALRVVLFVNGTVLREWEDLKSIDEMTAAVRRSLP